MITTPLNPERLAELQVQIGARIRHVLQQKGWKQQTLATHLGRGKSYVSLIIAGKMNLTLRIIADVEFALGEKIVEVVGREE